MNAWNSHSVTVEKHEKCMNRIVAGQRVIHLPYGRTQWARSDQMQCGVSVPRIPTSLHSVWNTKSGMDEQHKFSNESKLFSVDQFEREKIISEKKKKLLSQELKFSNLKDFRYDCSLKEKKGWNANTAAAALKEQPGGGEEAKERIPDPRPE